MTKKTPIAATSAGPHDATVATTSMPPRRRNRSDGTQLHRSPTRRSKNVVAGLDDRTSAPAAAEIELTPPAAQSSIPPVIPSQLAEVAGRGMAAFENIVLPTPAQVAAVRQMNTLLEMGRNQPQGQQRRAFRYLNESGAGKSTCAKLLKKHVEARAGRDPAGKPVLHVTLSSTGTPKSLATSILDAFGDGYSTRGEADLLLKRVHVAIEEFGVELLVIDELNHFKQKHLADDAANTIKNILTLGWVPIVLMGTTDAQSLFTRNRELKMRCAPQVVLKPFNHADASVHIWAELLHRLDAAIKTRGILPELSGLGEPVLAKDLCEASNGLIGELHNILLAALETTLLAGNPRISYDSLVEAVDAWCLADDTIDHNPLRLRKRL